MYRYCSTDISVLWFDSLTGPNDTASPNTLFWNCRIDAVVNLLELFCIRRQRKKRELFQWNDFRFQTKLVFACSIRNQFDTHPKNLTMNYSDTVCTALLPMIDSFLNQRAELCDKAIHFAVKIEKFFFCFNIFIFQFYTKNLWTQVNFFNHQLTIWIINLFSLEIGKFEVYFWYIDKFQRI